MGWLRSEDVQDDPQLFDLRNCRKGRRETSYFSGEDHELGFRHVKLSLSKRSGLGILLYRWQLGCGCPR